MRILLNNFNLFLRDIQMHFRKHMIFFSQFLLCKYGQREHIFSISKQLFGRCNLFSFIILRYLVPAASSRTVYIYIYIYTHTHTHTHTRIYIHSYIYAQFIYIHIYIYHIERDVIVCAAIRFSMREEI